jgi:general L-amino acid transport system permease protein
MLNYFMPPGTTFDLLVRVLIMVTLFASAYMAEVIRGGIAGIPKGQIEAASASGLSYWKTMYLIVMPQVLKISIPGIVNTFIGLFKDTTLVLIIGMFDLLGMGKAALTNLNWAGLHREMYLFVAVVFFFCCYGMSLYSGYLERKLDTENKFQKK